MRQRRLLQCRITLESGVVEFYGILGHAKALSDFFLSHLLGIELDDLSYVAHTCCFIRHDLLGLLKRKNYDIKN